MPKLLLGFLISLSTSSYATSGAGVTYHGRLVDPNGSPVSSSSVQFRLQVKTPGNESCLLYEEIQAKDMSLSNGVFSLTLNDGSGARQDASTYSIDQIFANRSTFSFPAGYCASGTTYFPNSADGRQLQVYFNDGSFSGWEPVPSQAINFVPMTIEAMQVGGYKKENLVKVATGVDTTGFDLSAANFTELIALVTGTSTQFVKPSAATFTAAPQWSGTPTAGSDLANKTYVDAQIAAGLPNFGTAGTYTKVTTDAKGRVSSGTTLAATDIPALDASKITSGVLPIANGGTNSSTALAGSKVMVSNATSIVEGMASDTAKSNNTFVMRDGSGNIAGALGTFDSLSVLLGGSLGLNGATSGTVSLVAPTAVTSYTMTLPATAGTSGQVLTTNGTGILSWSTASTGLPAAAGTAAAPGYAFSGNTNTGMFGAAANQIGFSTNGVERVRIDASGNVGVGTASPSVPLEVKGNALFGGVATVNPDLVISGNAPNLVFKDLNDTGQTQGQIDFQDIGGTNIGRLGGWGLYTNGEFGLRANSNLNLDAGNVTRIKILSSGNVGIGTNAPDTKLMVSENSGGDAVFHLQSTGNGAAIKLDGWGTYGFQLSSGGGGPGFTLSEYKNQSQPYFAAEGGLPNGSPTPLYIKNNGNVGIGTATPGSTLDVKGTLRLSGATSGYVGFAPAAMAGSTTYTLPSADGGTGQFLQTNGTGTLAWAAPAGGTPAGANTQVQFNDSGAFGASASLNWDKTNSRLGIGTASPSFALHVSTAASATPALFEHGCSGCASWINVFNSASTIGNTNAGIQFSVASSANVYGQITGISTTTLNGALAFATANGGSVAEKVRIDNAGNVGIGTTSPSTQLQINGANPLVRLEVPSGNSASNGMYLTENGTTRGGFYLYGSGYAAGQLSTVSSGDGGLFTVSNDSSRGEYRFNIEGGETKRIRFRGISSGYNAAEIKVTKSAGSNDNGTMVLKTTGHAIDQLALDATGNVGVGTATPQATLDVNGDIRLAKNAAAPVVCSATYDGRIALTSQYTTCVCKGGTSTWVNTTDGSTACAW